LARRNCSSRRHANAPARDRRIGFFGALADDPIALRLMVARVSTRRERLTILTALLATQNMPYVAVAGDRIGVIATGTEPVAVDIPTVYNALARPRA
jgi:hypothetical protein